LEDLLSKSYLLKIIPLEKFGAPENAMLTSGVSKQKQIKSILFDTGNTIWLGYNYGIVRNHLQNSQLTALYQLHDRDTEISTGNNWKVFGLGSDFILAGRRYGTLHRFDKKLKNELSLKVTEDSIESLALAPIDQIAVFGTSRGELLWLNPQNMEVRRRIDDAHGQLITSVHFLNDKILASSSLDRTIKIWNRTGKEIATLITPSPIHKMEVDKAGSKIFTLSRNERGLRVWDLKELKAKLTEIHPQLGWDD
jgi:WD40 repeat protein